MPESGLSAKGGLLTFARGELSAGVPQDNHQIDSASYILIEMQ